MAEIIVAATFIGFAAGLAAFGVAFGFSRRPLDDQPEYPAMAPSRFRERRHELRTSIEQDRAGQ